MINGGKLHKTENQYIRVQIGCMGSSGCLVSSKNKNSPSLLAVKINPSLSLCPKIPGRPPKAIPPSHGTLQSLWRGWHLPVVSLIHTLASASIRSGSCVTRRERTPKTIAGKNRAPIRLLRCWSISWSGLTPGVVMPSVPFTLSILPTNRYALNTKRWGIGWAALKESWFMPSNRSRASSLRR